MGSVSRREVASMHPQTGSVESFLSRHVLWCIAFRINFSGGYAGGATPVPIPNTEVKPSWADDTAAVRLWESRSLPENFVRHQTGNMFDAFFLF